MQDSSERLLMKNKWSWKKFQRTAWKIKTSALKTKRCGHCMMIQVSPSFFHFSDLQCFLNYLQQQLKLICCSLVVRAVRTSAGREESDSRGDGKMKTAKQTPPPPQILCLGFMIIKKWNLKIQHAFATSRLFWLQLLIFFPFLMVRICFGVLLASIMESPGAPTVAYLFS